MLASHGMSQHTQRVLNNASVSGLAMVGAASEITFLVSMIINS